MNVPNQENEAAFFWVDSRPKGRRDLVEKEWGWLRKKIFQEQSKVTEREACREESLLL